MALDVTVCCLCFKSSEILLDIFEEQCNDKSLAVIISQHFWFNFKRQKNIQKYICEECWNNVDNFHCFYNHVYTIHTKFYAREHETIKIEIDDPPGNKSELQKSFEELIQNEVVQFETLILNENHELARIIDIKEEEPLFEDCNNIENSNFKTTKGSKDKAQTKQLDFCGFDDDSNLNSEEHKTSSQKSSLNGSIVEEKAVEPVNNNVSMEKSSFENTDEHECSNIKLDKSNRKVKKIKTLVLDEDEAEISESTNNSDEEDKLDFPDDNDTSDSDGSANELPVKRSKLKKSRKIDSNSAAKLEEENIEIRKLFEMNCQLCSIQLNDYTDARLHYKSAHRTQGFLKCCDTKFYTHRLIMEHVQFHSSPDQFKCDQCGKNFIRNASLQEHLLRHLSTEDKPFKCTKCPKSYIKKFLLRRHLARHELENKQMEEPIKNLDENSKSGLALDSIEEHIKKKLYEMDPAVKAKIDEENEIIRKHYKMICEICSQPFYTFKGAQTHYRNKHARTGYLRCCKVKFMTRPTILEHVQSHLSPEDFKCDMCNKYFRSKHCLALHMENHQPLDRPFKCPDCTKSFVTEFNLTKHIETHNKVTKFQCDVCEKFYRNKSLLLLHKKEQHEPKEDETDSQDNDKMQKSEEIDTNSAAKLEEENIQIRKQFEMKCQLCSAPLDDYTHVKLHYREEHNKLGFLKCCDTKFYTRPTIMQHVQFHLSPDEFKCGQCGKIFIKKTSLKEHLLRHLSIEDKPFKCPKCPKSYVKNHLLRRHLGIHALENKQLEDPFEDVGGNNKSDLDSSEVPIKKKMRELDPAEKAKIDQENVTIREHYKMICEICCQPFDTFNDAQSHYRSKHAKAGYLRCCKVKFTTRPTILEHVQSHVSPEDFKCETCHKYFVNKHSLTIHMENHQPLDRPFKCSECSKGFATEYYLAKHIESHNKKEQREPGSKLQCDVCDKYYGSKSLLLLHKKERHDRSTVHICDVCAREFKSKNDFDKHHKNIHEKHDRLQCNVCGAWLKTKLYLRRHMLLHQDVAKKLPCTECDKRFPFRKALRNHMANVHPKEMFSCNMCDKQFKSRLSLKDHVANHTGFTLYKCPHCPKTFSVRATLYTHRRKMHKAEWEEHLKLKAAGLN